MRKIINTHWISIWSGTRAIFFREDCQKIYNLNQSAVDMNILSVELHNLSSPVLQKAHPFLTGRRTPIFHKLLSKNDIIMIIITQIYIYASTKSKNLSLDDRILVIFHRSLHNPFWFNFQIAVNPILCFVQPEYLLRFHSIKILITFYYVRTASQSSLGLEVFIIMFISFILIRRNYYEKQ